MVTNGIPTIDKVKPKGRWGGSSVPVLLFMFLTSAGISWFTVKMKEAREQCEAVQAIIELGGEVQYDYEFHYEYPDDCINGECLGCCSSNKREPPVPAWLRGLLGDDFFATVVNVELANGPLDANDALEYVRRLPQVQELVTGKNSTLSTKGLNYISGLTKIRAISIGCLDDNVQLENSGVLQRIEYLELGQADDDRLKQIEGLVQLRGLNICRCDFTDAGLKHIGKLDNLRDLVLDQIGFVPPIADAGLKYLATLHHLEALGISNTRITDAGLAHLKTLPHLRKLGLSHTDITDEGLQHLGEMRQLTDLSLANTKVTNIGMKHLRGLKHLQALGLTNTYVSDAGLEYLKDLTQLEGLNLSGTRITDAGLKHLTGLTRLQYLNINGTEVTDAEADSLKKMIPTLEIFR